MHTNCLLVVHLIDAINIRHGKHDPVYVKIDDGGIVNACVRCHIYRRAGKKNFLKIFDIELFCVGNVWFHLDYSRVHFRVVHYSKFCFAYVCENSCEVKRKHFNRSSVDVLKPIYYSRALCR